MCKLQSCGAIFPGENAPVEIVVDTPGERLDAFLAARLPDLSRSRIQVLIREQFIVVNCQPAKATGLVPALNNSIHSLCGSSGITGAA